MIAERHPVPKTTRYYPVFLSLEGRVCLVVGGGAVGERKIRRLLACGASVHLVSHDCTPWIREQCDAGRIVHAGTDYHTDCLMDAELVFAATSDAGLNRRIAADACVRKLWCNMATDPELGSFILPSIFERGPVTVATSTAGLSPAAAKLIREKLEERFGRALTASLHLMGLLRSAVLALGLDPSENQRIFREIAALPLEDWFDRHQRDEAVSGIRAVCAPWLGFSELNQFWDEAWKSSSSSSQRSATAVERSDT